MTPNEKRWSALVDLICVAIVLGTLSILAGCQRVDDPSTPRGGTTETRESSRAALVPVPGAGDAPVYVDEHTGCQYLGYTGHGLTPRMTKQGGNYHQMGCR